MGGNELLLEMAADTSGRASYQIAQKYSLSLAITQKKGKPIILNLSLYRLTFTL